ncbi:MAG: hypothetical protein ACXWGX_15060, partial [Usitatibacter sp.]
MADPLRAGRRAFHRAALAALALPLVARAQRSAPESPHRAIYMYQGADREARLVAEARKQREVVIYTSLNLKDSVPLTDAFERRSGLKVQLWRASSEKVLQRAVSEAQARRATMDIAETNGPEMESMHREKILQAVKSPHLADLIAPALRPHGEWVGTRLNVFVQAYNTQLVKK